MTTAHAPLGRARWVPLSLAASLMAGEAQAIKIDGPDDWAIRWDNTVKASTKYRLKDADARLSESFVNGAPQALNTNAGDQNFRNRGIVSERLDLLSEFDAVWRKDFGLRLSGAAWYDHKIRGTTDAGSDPYNGQTPPDAFSPNTRRLAGHKAEVLDAFAFGGWRLGNGMKVTARLGQFALQYGESVFFGDNGIARAQGPIDVDKLLASPGAQFKEIIRPVPQISTQLQITPEVAIGGYYQFRWDSDRLPPGGSYFSIVNIPWGSDLRAYAGPFVVSPVADVKPSNAGQFGLQLKWRVDESDFGVYFARYHDKAGQNYMLLDPTGTPTPAGPPGQYNYIFPEGVRTFGVSASHSVGSVNLSAEASVRDNMPLRSNDIAYFPGQPLPRYATGKTAHINVSWLALISPNIVAQEATFLGELAWNRVLSKTDPENWLDANVTRDALAMRLLYVPVYRQVLDGLDLNVPIGLGYSLKGFSSVTTWNAKNNGDLSIGLDATYLGVWQIGMSYTKYLGKAIPTLDFSGGGNPRFGLGNAAADRDFVSLSLRRTF